MKKILSILVMLLCVTSHSQNEIKSIVEKININLSTYGADPSLKEVFLNQQAKILDIQGFQIPLLNTIEVYEDAPRIYNGTRIIGNVSFDCYENKNCIKHLDGNISGIGFSFKSKKGAYLFIELIYKLEKELTY